MLYFVFTIQEGDILNCRMATTNLELAEKECIVAMRANRKRCVRIIEFDKEVKVGQVIWIDIEPCYPETHEIVILDVYEKQESIPKKAEWVEYLTVV